MSSFNSKEVQIARNSSYIFNFLSDFNNFEKLMPPQVTDWKSDGESCSFNIQNMAILRMRYRRRTPNSHIDIVSDGNVPFAFDLQCFIEEEGEESSKARLQFNADLNPMLKMVASKPLANLMDMLADKLKEYCESNH